jgi:succinate dehydrogenase / fumarate reductase, cytochrome b subunit
MYMAEAKAPPRPQYRNIHVTQIMQYRLPLAGYVSILHRVSGALMFALLPFVLYLFDRSLTSEIAFGRFQALTSHWFVKLLILALAWAYLHHFCAGVRHLFMDKHMGLEKGQAKSSAMAVFAVSLPLTALVALKLFGVF